MRIKHTPNLTVIGLLFISFISFLYSIKFLLFFSNLKFYNFILFVHTYKSLDMAMHKKIALDYPIIMYQLNIIGLSCSLIFLIFSYVFFRKARKILYDFVILFFMVAIFWYFDIFRFMGIDFYGIVPFSLLKDLKLYFLVNGLIYLLLTIGIYVFIYWRRKKLDKRIRLQ